MSYLRSPWVWIVGVIFLLPVAYFVVRFADQMFRDSAMGNWFATMLGILAGVPIALELNRRQQHQQEISDTNAKNRADQDWLETIISRIQLELSDNRNRIRNLASALSQSPSAREDLWNWAITFVDSLAFTAYANLTSSGLERLLPHDLSFWIYQAYSMNRDLRHAVKQSAAQHSFLLGYRGDEEEANKQLSYIGKLSQEVLRNTETALGALKRHFAVRDNRS